MRDIDHLRHSYSYAFAVLAPVGPLRRINEKTHEYSDQVLRFLMFTAEDRYDAPHDEILQETEDECIRRRKTLYSRNESGSAQNLEHATKKNMMIWNLRSSVRLGMGDFVFYNLLTGKATATHSAMCVAGSVIGILVAFVITLTILSGEDETAPALPVSITIALLLHFGIYLFVELFYRQIVITPKLFLLL